MGENAPLLSIVVPTRDRPDYASAAIRSLLKIADDDLEIVVEDNSQDSSLESRLSGIVDSRLSYRRDAAHRSMSENFDAAVARATGEYVSIIGDDDGVNPEILDAARWARDHDVDALSSSTPAHYVWPDLDMPWAGAMRASELRVHRFSGAMRRVEPSVELQDCLKRTGQRFERLPRSYCGIVRRSCYAAVRQRAGTFFPGVSPDLAGAVALAGVVRESWFVDYPLFLPGSSARSNAGISGMRRHVGELRDQPHLPVGCEERWSTIVPAFYSVQTVWAESVVSALRATGQDDRLRAFNLPYLFACLLVFHPPFRLRVLRQLRPALAAVGAGAVGGAVRCAWHIGLLWVLKAKVLFGRLVGLRPAPPLYRKEGAESIEEAVDDFREYLQRSGHHLAASTSPAGSRTARSASREERDATLGKRRWRDDAS
jgi:hypothetical protein